MGMRGPKPGQAVRKGIPNKKSFDISEKLAALGCDPIEGMARIAIDAETAFKNRLRELNDGAEVEIPGLYKDLGLAGSMYKELAQYVAPKRKAIEVSGDKDNPIAISLSLPQIRKMAKEFIDESK